MLSIHFLYFLFNWRRVNPWLYLRKYIETEIFYSTSQKTNKTKGEKILSKFIIITFKTPEKLSLIAAGFYIFMPFARTLIKFLKTNICVKILILLLLLRKNQTLFVLQVRTAWVKYLAMLQRLSHVDVSKSFPICQSFSILQS